MRLPRARRSVAVAAAGAVLVAAGSTGGPGPAAPAPARAAGCITRLPVKVSFPNAYAAAYDRVVPVTVHGRGPVIRRMRAELYAFDGTLLARGSRRAPFRSSVRVRMRLRLGALQPGGYTVVITGEPNPSPSCGPKTYVRVKRFRRCQDRLPLRWTLVPGGQAADYGGWLSFGVSTRGRTVRDVEATVHGYDGRFYGRTRLKGLYGDATLDVPLRRELVPGGYTVRVEGRLNQPRSCGPKFSERTLTLR